MRAVRVKELLGPIPRAQKRAVNCRHSPAWSPGTSSLLVPPQVAAVAITGIGEGLVSTEHLSHLSHHLLPLIAASSTWSTRKTGQPCSASPQTNSSVWSRGSEASPCPPSQPRQEGAVFPRSPSLSRSSRPIRIPIPIPIPIQPLRLPSRRPPRAAAPPCGPSAPCCHPQ